MARFTGSVLLDTNTIIEAHRVSAWRALSSGYALETVETVVMETHTGFQRRDPAQQIDQGALRASLGAVHAVSKLQEAKLKLKLMDEAIDLDAGEFALWAHIMDRENMWMLCGPDKASLRFGVRQGFRDRMISLEQLLGDAGMQRTRPALRENFSKAWLDRVLGEFALEGMRR
jgi:predicted nucleic acid-binding protein